MKEKIREAIRTMCTCLVKYFITHATMSTLPIPAVCGTRITCNQRVNCTSLGFESSRETQFFDLYLIALTIQITHFII